MASARSRSGCRYTGDPALDFWVNGSPVARLISFVSRQAGGGDRTDIRRRSSHAAPEQRTQHRQQVFQLSIALRDQWPDADDPARVPLERGRSGVCQGDRIRIDRAAAGGCPQPANSDVVSAYCPTRAQQRKNEKRQGGHAHALVEARICSIALMAALCVTIENAMIEGARAFDDAGLSGLEGGLVGTGGRYDTSKARGAWPAGPADAGVSENPGGKQSPIRTMAARARTPAIAAPRMACRAS